MAKGPSMRWNESNTNQLLLKVIGQNPNIPYDAEEIARTWDGEPRPTARAVRNTFTDLRNKAMKDGSGKAPATPTSRKSTTTSSSTPRSTKSKLKSKQPANAEDDDQDPLDPKVKSDKSPTITPSTSKKRTSTTTLHTPNKRPKTKKSADTDTEDETSLSTTASSDSDPLTPLPTTTTPTDPRVPRHSKTLVHYVQIDGRNDSESDYHSATGGDADGADDGDFNLAASHRGERGEDVEDGDADEGVGEVPTWRDIEI